MTSIPNLTLASPAGWPDEESYAVLPAEDVEVLGLCALVWATREVAQRIVAVLEPSDFECPWYGSLFALTAGLVQAGHPHGAHMVSSAVATAGTIDGHSPNLLNRALTDITTAGSLGYEADYYALQILTQSYRRGYVTAAQSLAQIAEEAPTDELYELMCKLGREQRTAKARLNHAMQELS
ncbi:DNA helicase [Antrihabitans sp. YC3-6]|uniref:DNA helicase n=1 Tax=Antrihabitans stalagmiti TaxID=2799499 RepID=A0A934NT69_9NOCA|nr:DNA helicase [Antrihabitans stalagmiti]MBJ8340855.1 DNA helicase [Antrihabitans stalagmiti]